MTLKVKVKKRVFAMMYHIDCCSSYHLNNLTLCLLGSSVKNLQTDWNQIRPDMTSGLIKIATSGLIGIETV